MTKKGSHITSRDRLVGALGGAGGSIVLGCLLSYLIVPEMWDLQLFLAYEAVGIFLIVMAVVVLLKKRKPLLLPAISLILLCLFPHIASLVFAITASYPLQISEVSENVFVIEHSLFRVTIEKCSPTCVRLTYNVNDSIVYYDILIEESDVVLFANGTESYRLAAPQTVSEVTASADIMGATLTTFYWDGVRFVKGQYIKYPHPDRDYYEISPFSGWSYKGNKLYHNQIDQATSRALNVGGGVVIGAALGALIGLMVGGEVGTIVGAAVGAVITAVLPWVGDVVFLDEYDCMWWWVSEAYVQWLIDNASWLAALYFIYPHLAVAEAMSAFLSCGYLRVGSATFHDAVGAGNPSPQPNDPHVGGFITPIDKFGLRV